jgi:uridine phosphorylase
MEAATIFTLARRHGIAAACVLGVTDVASPEGARRGTPQQIEEIGLRVGEIGYAGLKSRIEAPNI